MLNAIKKKLVTKKIRGFAERLKTNKESIVEGIFKTFNNIGIGDALAPVLSYGSVIIRLLNLVQTIYEVFNKSEALRKMTLDLLYNIINDIALRINEFANVIDKTLADDEVLDAATLLDATVKRAKEVRKKIYDDRIARYEEGEQARKEADAASTKDREEQEYQKWKVRYQDKPILIPDEKREFVLRFLKEQGNDTAELEALYKEKDEIDAIKEVAYNEREKKRKEEKLKSLYTDIVKSIKSEIGKQSKQKED